MFEEEPRISLNQKAFKALASDTRVKILKLLRKRRHTQTELASEFEMAIPTIKQHLDELEEAGLVKGVEEGRKWIYYELTDAGQTVLNPERKRIWIVLILLVFTVVGGITGYVRQLLALMYAGTSQFATANVQTAKMAVEPIATAVENAPLQDMAQEAIQVAPSAAPPMATAIQNATTSTIASATEPAARQLPWAWIIYFMIIAVLLGLLIYYWRKNKESS